MRLYTIACGLLILALSIGVGYNMVTDYKAGSWMVGVMVVVGWIAYIRAFGIFIVSPEFWKKRER